MDGVQSIKGQVYSIVHRPGRFQPAGGPYKTARLSDVFARRLVIRPVARPDNLVVLIEGHGHRYSTPQRFPRLCSGRLAALLRKKAAQLACCAAL